MRGDEHVARTAHPSIRHVTLVDPVVTGHHVAYCRWVADAILTRRVPCLIVGPRGLCDAVAADLPTISTHHVEFDPGGNRVLKEVRRIAFVREAADAAHAAGSDHIHFLYLDGFVFALAARFRRFKEVTVHATLHTGSVVPGAAGWTLRRSVEWRLLSRMLRRGLRLVVHGTEPAEAITARVREARVSPVRYPIEPKHAARPTTIEARERLGFDPGVRLLLAFGGTRHDKGTDLAIAALRHLPDDVHLAIAGQAEYFGESELRRLASDLGVAHRVVLRLGHVPEEDVAAWFSAADVALLPYRQGFSGQSGPLTIAAGLGRPVVASDGWVTGDTVRRYRLGDCAPAEDPAAFAAAVARVLENPPTPDVARFLEEHSLDAFADAVIAGYRNAKPIPSGCTSFGRQP